MQHLTLVTLAGLVALASTQSGPPPKPVYRRQAEYRSNVSCPNEYVVDQKADNREGFHVCTKGNIVDCDLGSSWYLQSKIRNQCQLCTCDSGDGGFNSASCPKIDCAEVPEGTPLPRRGALKRPQYRQKCRPTQEKVCDEGCNFLARDRRCVYCDCSNTLKGPFYA